MLLEIDAFLPSSSKKKEHFNNNSKFLPHIHRTDAILIPLKFEKLNKNKKKSHFSQLQNSAKVHKIFFPSQKRYIVSKVHILLLISTPYHSKKQFPEIEFQKFQDLSTFLSFTLSSYGNIKTWN